MPKTLLFSTPIAIVMTLLVSAACNNHSTGNTSKTVVSSDTVALPASVPMTTISITAIKGNHLDKAAEIFAYFKCTDLKRDKSFASLDSCLWFLDDNYMDYTKKDIAIRGFWFDNGWTIIYDPEMVDFIEDNAITAMSKKLNSEVLTFTIQTTSGTFAFSKYNKQKQRFFLSVDTEISKNSGTALTEEQGLNISQDISVDDMLKLADKFGIDLAMKNAKLPFVVKELSYTDELKKELKEFR